MIPRQGPAPVTMRLGERARNLDGSFQVRVSFGETSEYDVAVTDPADETAEAQLAWYFEKHLRYPFLDKDLEAAAVQRITDYGQALFSQVFGGAAYHDYCRLRDRAFDGCRIEVSGSAGLHRMHWEAMRDPDLPAPLAVRLGHPPGGRAGVQVRPARSAAYGKHSGDGGSAGRP